MKAHHLIPFLVFVALVIFLSIGLGLNPNEKESALIDKPAPVFELPQVENPQKKLGNQDFIGKVSLFNAWASWCVTCRYEHPLLMALAEQGSINLYGLNYKDTLDKAQQVLAREGNPYIASAYDPSGRIGIDWGITGTPETFIIDKQGIVRYKHVGPLNTDVLRNTILPLIEQLEQSG